MFLISRLSRFLFGSNPTQELPHNIRATIESIQLRSEKLVNWILLVVIILVSILYVIIPSLEPHGHHVKGIPTVITVFLSFAILRVILAYLEYLPEWFLVLSTVFDAAILMLLVWFLHIFFDQPPVFSLNVPIVNYIYVLLALRTLRLEGKYLIIVGATGILGYLFILLYAIHYSPAGVITRDYTKYISSEYIFIPGEVNKMLVMFLVTVFLYIAVTKGRNLLISTIKQTRAAKELSRFFEPEIASNIIDSNESLQPGYSRQSDATILYCDIRGFTTLSKKMPGSEVMELLTEYQSLIIKIAFNCHGSIDKFLGDGVLISFNAITSHPKTHALDALHAALQISKANAEWQQRRKKENLQAIELGISIATGLVTVGVVGDLSRMEYTIIGDPVNLSAKLNKHCKIENTEIIVTKKAYELALSQGFETTRNVEKRYARHIDGIEEPIDLVLLSP